MQGALLFNIVVLLGFLLLVIRNRESGRRALALAVESLNRVTPLLIILVLVLILTQHWLSENMVIGHINSLSGPTGYLMAAFLGAVVHIPLFITFPIGGELLDAGINPGFIAVLITSLVMVHTFSIPIEMREMGWRFALLRNALSLVAAVCIGILVGVLY